jgi:hypothetical protein
MKRPLDMIADSNEERAYALSVEVSEFIASRVSGLDYDTAFDITYNVLLHNLGALITMDPNPSEFARYTGEALAMGVETAVAQKAVKQ